MGITYSTKKIDIEEYFSASTAFLICVFSMVADVDVEIIAANQKKLYEKELLSYKELVISLLVVFVVATVGNAVVEVTFTSPDNELTEEDKVVLLTIASLLLNFISFSFSFSFSNAITKLDEITRNNKGIDIHLSIILNDISTLF